MKELKTKKTIVTALILLVFVISFFYWLHGLFFISTDNAYINANIIQIAPRVTGQVNRLFIINNQYVKQGQLLFSLDPEPYQVAVEQAEAKLKISEAQAILADSTEKRTQELVIKKAASQQEGDAAISNLIATHARVSLDRANLAESRLNLRYTQVGAPTSGWVANMTLREGQVVTASQHLFALISDNEFWVDANFKETDIHYIKLGDRVEIKSDLYPSHVFHGVVQSISGGSGEVFSLLPPENATGNWVKVTQRVPVRIRILDRDPHYPLRIGTSATVTIRIR